MRGRRTAGCFALLGALVVTAACGGDDDSDEARGTDKPEPKATTTTTASTTTTTAPRWIMVTGPDGDFELTLPPEWMFVAIDGSNDGVGAKLYPNHPTRAEFAQGVADIIANEGPRLLAAGGDGTNTMAPYIGIERNPANIDLDKAVQLFKDSYAKVGVTQLSEGRLQGKAGEIAWVANTTQMTFQRVDYLVLHGGQLWKLAYVAMGELAPTKPTADKIAMSLGLR